MFIKSVLKRQLKNNEIGFYDDKKNGKIIVFIRNNLQKDLFYFIVGGINKTLMPKGQLMAFEEDNGFNVVSFYKRA